MRRRIRSILVAGATAILVFASGPGGGALAQESPPESAGILPPPPFVMRVHYEEIADIEGLVRYDVWETNNLEEKYVLVSGDENIYRELRAAGWRVEIDDEATANLRQPAIPALHSAFRLQRI